MISTGALVDRINNLATMVFGNASSESTVDGGYDPSPMDVFVVREMLSRAVRLPPDIVDVIFDYAEYWAHSTNYIDYLEERRIPMRVVGTSKSENRFLLRSVPIGLTTLDDRKNLAEGFSYDTNEAKPRPLKTEFDPVFFKKLANHPMPKLEHPVRKIVFTIKSRDQGFGGPRRRGPGPYDASWTWFEAGLERFDREQTCDPQCTADLRYNSPKSPAPSLPLCALRSVYPPIETSDKGEGEYKYHHSLAANDKYLIQRNKTANRDLQDNVVTWSRTDNVDPESEEARELEAQGRGKASMTGEFVRSLKMGDVVSIWAKARFPAWVNHVEKIKVDIYWAV
ncbi:hypothetical protein ACRE_035730 [Hapsidospora chrysogenum ATCC 11550]|uniref:Uncharacterized protein n=1 Tax=Hapsidospora chrysogenum (strain ATCC 11550 / CBS 779.69 / DSM 880 / IAM 14645 / JCM 23072 / IMI 49137) TaxID=857340 RepID=A0A086T8G6_HAPC1|nr:hypothetical protein ACRE_035730 [Hapsidospora chrysogenum ATCC 11550]